MIKIKNRYLIYFVLVGLLLGSFIGSLRANASDTGYKSNNNEGWAYNEMNSPQNARSSDNNYVRSRLIATVDEQDFYEYNFNAVIPKCSVINGILLEIECYGGLAGSNYDIKLSWNGGTNLTTAKNTGNLPTSDTNTYIQLGSSSDLWGHNWTYSELYNDKFLVYVKHVAGGGYNFIDHIRVKVYYTWIAPDMPISIRTIQKSNNCTGVDFLIDKGIGADYTLVKWATEGYPTFMTGIELYNDTGNTFSYSFNRFNTDYYIVAWSYNTTYCAFSGDYDSYYHSPCSNEIVIYETIINCTGTLNYTYNNNLGYNITANYTGNTSLCSGIYWFNYSDNNITINISFNKQTDNYDNTNYAINEDNWLYLAGALLLDNAQFFTVILLSIWLFFVFKFLETRDLTIALATLGFSFPLSIIMATISFSYSFGFIVVFLIPLVSLIFVADGYFSKPKKRF